jgi:hypothetical protein
MREAITYNAEIAELAEIPGKQLSAASALNVVER